MIIEFDKKELKFIDNLFNSPNKFSISDNFTISNAVNKGFKSVVFSCVDLIAETIASLGYKIYKKNELIYYSKDINKNKKNKYKMNDYIVKLLRKPNRYQTWFDFIYLIIGMYLITGEVYIYKVTDKLGITQELIVIPSFMIEPVFKNDDIIGYTLINSTNNIDFDLDEIIYDYKPSLNNYNRGESVLSKIATEFDIHILAKEYAKRFYKNGAVPLGILKTDKTLSEKQINILRSQWKSIHSGVSNSWEVAVLHSGLDYKEISPSPANKDFTEQSKWTRDDILAAFRVPPFKLGYMDNVSSTSAKEQNEIFASDCIYPKVVKLSNFINEKLIPSLVKVNYQLVFDNPIPKDRELEVQKAKITATFGVGTVNEIRQFLGLEPLDDDSIGEYLVEPLNLPEGRKPADERGINEEGSKQIDDSIDILKQIDRYLNSIDELY